MFSHFKNKVFVIFCPFYKATITYRLKQFSHAYFIIQIFNVISTAHLCFNSSFQIS